jgi:hypothetical protein
MPDILHQLYQGMFKHLKNWVIEAYGATEINACCRRLPPNHNIRIFMKGLSSLNRITGQEHEQISRFLLGLIIDLPLTGENRSMSSAHLVAALRSFLDFLYLAQYPVHSDETLAQMEEALKGFHHNKNIFVEIGVHEHFKIPKLHSLNHYISSIRDFGTTDNTNTETTERLHIDMAKDTYRASNQKDEYPQMTLWLERKEKIARHDKFVSWLLDPSRQNQQLVKKSLLTLGRPPHIFKMTKKPSVASVTFDKIVRCYHAPFFPIALARYICELNKPSLRGQALEYAATDLSLDFDRVAVYHRIKFIREDPVTGALPTVDAIHIQPARKDQHRKHWLPGQFDPALIHVSKLPGLKGEAQI